MLVDTDILIWHLRGYSSATITLDNIDSLTISAATYLEILQGVNSKADRFAGTGKVIAGVVPGGLA